MKSHTITLSVPQNLYEQLEQVAKVSDLSLEEVFIQTLKGGMPPSVKKVPEEFHEELLSLNKLGDEALWQVMAGNSPSDIELDEERHNREDFSTLRRAYAFSLLKWRGHPMPSPQEMLL